MKKEILKRTEFYYEDDPNSLNQKKLSNIATDDKFKDKHNVFVASAKPVIARSQAYLDIFNVHKYFPTDIDYVLTFTRNPESFCLMGLNSIQD